MLGASLPSPGNEAPGYSAPLAPLMESIALVLVIASLNCIIWVSGVLAIREAANNGMTQKFLNKNSKGLIEVLFIWCCVGIGGSEARS